VTLTEQLVERSRQEGRLEGERRILLRILARLGIVSADVAARVEAAGQADLERWAEVALSAKSIEDVFET